LGACICCGIFNVNPGIIISIAGALIGVNILYFFPILIHFKCLYPTKKNGVNDNDQEKIGLQEKLIDNATD